MNWDNLIVHPRLLNDLYQISREMRYTAPELLTGYVAWLQANLREYELTKEDCRQLIAYFAARVDAVEGSAA